MHESKRLSSGSYFSADQGLVRSAPNWSADRAMKQYPEFLYASADGDEPVLFTGEMVTAQASTKDGKFGYFQLR